MATFFIDRPAWHEAIALQIKGNVPSNFIWENKKISVIYNDLAQTKGHPNPQKQPFIQVLVKVVRGPESINVKLASIASILDGPTSNCALQMWSGLSLSSEIVGKECLRIFEAYAKWCGRGVVMCTDRVAGYVHQNILGHGTNWIITPSIRNQNTYTDIVLMYKDLNQENYSEYPFVSSL